MPCSPRVTVTLGYQRCSWRLQWGEAVQIVIKSSWVDATCWETGSGAEVCRSSCCMGKEIEQRQAKQHKKGLPYLRSYQWGHGDKAQWLFDSLQLLLVRTLSFFLGNSGPCGNVTCPNTIEGFEGVAWHERKAWQVWIHFLKT